MTASAEVARHIDHVRRATVRGGELDTHGPNASINNPAWFLGGSASAPTSARRRLHAHIRRETLEGASADYPKPHALILAGPPGAGKSTARSGALANDILGHVVIDPDEIKRTLLLEAQRDGSYESFLKPSQVKSWEAEGEKFFPLELSALVHVEAVSIGEDIRNQAIREHRNLVLDWVMSNPAVAIAAGEQLSQAGYAVDVVCVDVPHNVSEHRIRQRWSEAYQETLAGRGDLMGGRWVPSDYAAAMFDRTKGVSRSRQSAEMLAQKVSAVQRLRVFRTPLPDAAMELALDLRRHHPGGPLLRADATVAQPFPRNPSRPFMRAPKSQPERDF
ncbi:MAG: zeta toxin family protein [Dermabacter sp.]|nr:zeta toxin family protein [Dermabacter sp.]